MSFKSAFVAATALLASSANAHIIMAQPVPYSVDKIDNSPITASQFPCKSQNGFTVSTMNNMKVGDKQTINFKGTAVHGGGSCQLSVTTDTNPTAKSKFKVIKSIEGGCPGLDGKTNTYDFQLPDSIPNGKATFAWTWFSKESGAPELYMNCAPIDVTGGASDTSKFDQLPDMLVANINNGCTSPQNFATKYPNPGSVVEMGQTNDQKPPTGNCGASSGGGDAPAASSAAGGAPASSAAGGGGASSAAGGSPATSAAAAPSAATSNAGGVFAPGASSAAAGGQSTMTTLVTVTGSPDSPAQATSAPAAGTGSPAAPSSPSGGGGSATCSQNGAIVCNGPTQFGLCNNGNVVWQAVAAGTTCSNGSIQKRSYHRQLKGRVPRPRVVPGQEFTPDN